MLRAVPAALVVLAALGLGLWLASLGFAQRAEVLASEGWTTTRGVVVTADVTTHHARKGSRAWWNPVWSYRYEVNGKAYVGTSSLSAAARVTPFSNPEDAQQAANARPVGAEVAVQFDPQQPEVSLLDRRDDVSSAWLMLVTGAAVVLTALGGGVVLARRVRRS